MVKRGLVNLDDPAQKYLPTANVKFPSYNGTIGREGGGLAHNNNTNSKPVIITLEDLATHTSGLPDFPPRNQSYTTQQIYNAISNTNLQSEPGTRVNYSDIGMALLGHILSLRSGVPYEQLVKNKISDVLGMDSTGISLTSEKSRLAKGHIDGKEVYLEFLPELIQPAGVLHSTANNLLEYLSANMGFIQTKLNDIMQETQLITFPAPLDTEFYIGLGWIIYTNFAREVIFHNGTIYGYESFVGFNPSSKIGLVILCSCDEKNVPPQPLSILEMHIY
jgi:serine-type D-Ala-D-Ala carboxypeptidase/endopeptidase